jgi:hypothetical protein
MAAKRKKKTKSRSKARKSPAKKRPAKRRKAPKRKAAAKRKKARTPAQRKATEALVRRNKARKKKTYNLPPLPRVPLHFRGKLGDKTLVPGQYQRGPNDGGEAKTLFMKPRRDVGVDFED